MAEKEYYACDDKKLRPQYKKDCKKHRKEFKKLVKNMGPWDDFTESFLEEQIDWWIDYYTLGYNVWGMERCDCPEFECPDRPSRLQIALRLKELYNDWKDENDPKLWKEKEKAFWNYFIEYHNDMWD